jgi:hypothetical protein
MASPLGTVLQPYLRGPVNPSRWSAYLRFYHATRLRSIPSETASESLWSSGKYEQRLRDLKALRPLNEPRTSFSSSLYPRMKAYTGLDRKTRRVTIKQFQKLFKHLEEKSSTQSENELRFVIEGTVYAIGLPSSLSCIC